MMKVNYTYPTIFNYKNVKKRGGRNIFINNWIKSIQNNKVSPEFILHTGVNANNDLPSNNLKKTKFDWRCCRSNNKVIDNIESVCCSMNHFYGECKCLKKYN